VFFNCLALPVTARNGLLFIHTVEAEGSIPSARKVLTPHGFLAFCFFGDVESAASLTRFAPIHGTRA
jgi:hypothetical protein